VLGLVGLLASFAAVVTRKTPRSLRGLLLGAATVALITVGLVSILGIADELLAKPKETIRFVAKTLGALAFLGAGVLRYLLGDRMLPRRQISMYARSRESLDQFDASTGRIEQVMTGFSKIALGQVLFAIALVASAVLLMSR
jgi:hypothetical protein